MTITIRYIRREDEQGIKSFVHGNSAAECMKTISALREYHDIAKYTPIEIINVED